jgi:hypothetical protein
LFALPNNSPEWLHGGLWYFQLPQLFALPNNSPEWLHGGLWYFQLPQLFALPNSMYVLDRIVVGYDKSFEDDVVIALNGQEVMSLVSFHEINFEGVQDHTEGG